MPDRSRPILGGVDMALLPQSLRKYLLDIENWSARNDKEFASIAFNPFSSYVRSGTITLARDSLGRVTSFTVKNSSNQTLYAVTLTYSGDNVSVATHLMYSDNKLVDTVISTLQYSAAGDVTELTYA